MRHTALLSVVLLTAACLPQPQSSVPSPSPSPTAAPTPSPSPAPTPSPTATPTGAAPKTLRFADPLRGWLGTAEGILGTTDGGATWDRQLASGSITKLWSYDATHAWALAGMSDLYRTVDGTHWLPIAPTPFPLIVDVDALSTDLLWAIGVAKIPDGATPTQLLGNVMRSTDGGATWQVVGTHTMWSVCFDTPTDGIGAEGKQIFRSADAGRTWFPIATLAINDDGPYWYPTLGCPDGANDRLQVTEPGAALGHAPYLVYRTNDAGRTWTLEFREPYTRGSTTPADTAQLGSYPSTFGALPGGRTWFVTCTPAANTQEFLLLGPVGETLARGTVPIVQDCSSAQLIDPSHVVAVSRNAATVIATDNGGGTWRTIYTGKP